MERNYDRFEKEIHLFEPFFLLQFLFVFSGILNTFYGESDDLFAQWVDYYSRNKLPWKSFFFRKYNNSLDKFYDTQFRRSSSLLLIQLMSHFVRPLFLENWIL